MAATTQGNQLTRQEQDRMCRSKRRYRREQAAIMEVARRRHEGGFRAGVRVYRCQICPFWHISTGDKT